MRNKEIKEVWIVGQYRAGEKGNVVWDLQGVFNKKSAAIKACKYPDYFIMPIEMNESCSDEPQVNSSTIYPLKDSRKRMKVMRINGYVLLPDNFQGTFLDALKYMAKIEEESYGRKTQKTTIYDAQGPNLWDRFLRAIKRGKRFVVALSLTNHYFFREEKWEQEDLKFKEETKHESHSY